MTGPKFWKGTEKWTTLRRSEVMVSGAAASSTFCETVKDNRDSDFEQEYFGLQSNANENSAGSGKEDKID